MHAPNPGPLLYNNSGGSSCREGGKMLRRSFDEESDFQNKLNFSKHKPRMDKLKSMGGMTSAVNTQDLLRSNFAVKMK